MRLRTAKVSAALVILTISMGTSTPLMSAPPGSVVIDSVEVDLDGDEGSDRTAKVTLTNLTAEPLGIAPGSTSCEEIELDSTSLNPRTATEVTVTIPKDCGLTEGVIRFELIVSGDDADPVTFSIKATATNPPSKNWWPLLGFPIGAGIAGALFGGVRRQLNKTLTLTTAELEAELASEVLKAQHSAHAARRKKFATLDPVALNQFIAEACRSVNGRSDAVVPFPAADGRWDQEDDTRLRQRLAEVAALIEIAAQAVVTDADSGGSDGNSDNETRVRAIEAAIREFSEPLSSLDTRSIEIFVRLTIAAKAFDLARAAHDTSVSPTQSTAEATVGSSSQLIPTAVLPQSGGRWNDDEPQLATIVLEPEVFQAVCNAARADRAVASAADSGVAPRREWENKTELGFLPATWSFKDAWATNVTVLGAILTTIIGSSSIVKTLVGVKDADALVAVAVVGVAIAAALAGGAPTVAAAFRRNAHYTVGGVLWAAAATATAATGELIVVTWTACTIDDLPDPMKVLAAMFAAAALSVLCLYMWRTTLEVIKEGFTPVPKPTIDPAIVAAALTIAAERSDLPVDNLMLEAVIADLSGEYPMQISTTRTSDGDQRRLGF